MKVNNTLFISKNLSTVKKYKKIYNIIHINELKQYLNNNLADTKIDSLLSNFSFNKANIGYDYLRTCLQYCVKNNIRNIPKIYEIYSEVSKIYGNNISSKQIGWNIEKAIMTMKLNTKKEVIYSFFEFMPTPKNFIHTILYNYYIKY